jgi:hypothetical protein
VLDARLGARHARGRLGGDRPGPSATKKYQLTQSTAALPPAIANQSMGLIVELRGSCRSTTHRSGLAPAACHTRWGI